jgi:RHS repeat-associated protein
MTLTERLFSGQVLDSSTGLYYYGHGRYYDPSIGRYISPDPYLDAPFSSQRLDRYNFGFNNPLRYQRSEALPDFTVDLAKGTLVSEGLPAAALTSNFGQLAVDAGAARWFVKEAFGALAEAGQQSVFGGLTVGRIAISASRNRLTTRLSSGVQDLFPDIGKLKGTYTKQTVWSRFLSLSAREADDLRAELGALEFVKPGRGSSSRWAARVTQRMARLDLMVSFVLAVGVDVGFSLYEDIQMRDIYGLTNDQIAYRAAVRGVGGLTAVFAATAVGGAVSVAWLPPVAIPILVALGVEVAWELWVEPFVFGEAGLYGPYEPRRAVMTSANRLHPARRLP